MVTVTYIQRQNGKQLLKYQPIRADRNTPAKLPLPLPC